MSILSGSYLVVGSACVALAVPLAMIRGAPVFDSIVSTVLRDRSAAWERLGLPRGGLVIGMRIWMVTLISVFAGFWWGLHMPPIAIVLTGLVAWAPKLLIDEILRQRRTLLRDQLVTATHLLASQTEAGQTLAVAIQSVAHDTPLPLSHELRRITADHENGLRLTDAFQAVRDRLQHEPFTLFAAAIQVTIARGGRVNHALSRIGHSLVENQRLERKIASETASGRRVIQILAICPVIFLGIMQLLYADHTPLMFTTLTGQVLLATAILLEVAGIRLAMKIMRFE